MNAGYYVSLIRGRKVALLAGPFAEHAEALAIRDRAHDLACELDGWAHFDPCGTCKRTPADKLGVLNERLGIKDSRIILEVSVKSVDTQHLRIRKNSVG